MFLKKRSSCRLCLRLLYYHVFSWGERCAYKCFQQLNFSHKKNATNTKTFFFQWQKKILATLICFNPRKLQIISSFQISFSDYWAGFWRRRNSSADVFGHGAEVVPLLKQILVWQKKCKQMFTLAQLCMKKEAFKYTLHLHLLKFFQMIMNQKLSARRSNNKKQHLFLFATLKG